MSTPNWTELNNLFHKQQSGLDDDMRIGTPIIKSKTEIVLPVRRGEYYNARLWIYKYNPTTHELYYSNRDSDNVFYKRKLTFSCITDAATNIIYIPSKYGMYEYDLTQNTMKLFSYDKQGEFPAAELYGWEDNVTSIIVDNKLHTFSDHYDSAKIAQSEYNRHTIYDMATSKVISNGVELPKAPDGVHRFSFCFCRVVHLKAQNKLLFFCGEFHDRFVTYDLVKEEWKLLPDLKRHNDGGFGTAYVLTKDERYLVILYSYWGRVHKCDLSDYDSDDSNWDSDGTRSQRASRIEVIDLEMKVAKISKIGVPGDIDGQGNLLFMMDDWDESVVVVHGFVKEWFKQLPSELIHVIIEYYNLVDVHLLHPLNGNHWKISLADLLHNNE